ncbi:DUF4142 domain-containing protein [Xenophilus arseniciresistens]|uniref:DUF4142 domain-containing protein n=1 Tax=Xenophilus arseniciresistens TaxID=1283306 RepID=A0AAE3N4C0_9BURK|nr:DUF4142 domain-containing protein [Xenophilus arseniciresistens]MDA7415006.1 DUF4142 domain-containing protein [Xenophilus arseniciresistens]
MKFFSPARPFAPFILAAAIACAPAAWAQAQPPSPTEAAQGVRDARLSDSDRIFMRGVAPLVIRMRQLGEIGRKQLPAGEGRRFASALSEQSDQAFGRLKTLSQALGNTIPMDMSDLADQRLRALAQARGSALQAQYKALAVEWLEEERKSLHDGDERGENERVRQWAAELHKARGDMLAQARRLPG